MAYLSTAVIFCSDAVSYRVRVHMSFILSMSFCTFSIKIIPQSFCGYHLDFFLYAALAVAYVLYIINKFLLPFFYIIAPFRVPSNVRISSSF